jgi:hypothetical protein
MDTAWSPNAAGVRTGVRRRRTSDAAAAFRLLILGIVGLGCVLRVVHVLADRGMWSDELSIASNIVGRTYGELMLPLDDHQAAPIGWLFIQKALALAVDDVELGLRLFPLLTGTLAVVVFAKFCVRHLGRGEAVFCVLSLSLLPSFLLYSGEVKQYISDVFLTTVLLLLAYRGLEPGRRSSGLYAALLIVGLVAIPLSHPVVLVLAGVGTGWFLQDCLARRVRDAAIVAGIAAAWLALFAAQYFAVYAGHTEIVAAMRIYWQRHFAPVPPANPKEFLWYYNALFQVVDSAFYLGRVYRESYVVASVLTAWLFIYGAYRIVREDLPHAAVIFLPLLLALGLSALQWYPFGGRFLMFAAPLTIVCTARGVHALWTTAGVPRPVAAAAPALVLCLPLALTAYEYVGSDRKPFETADNQAAMAAIAANYQPGDAIYAAASCLPDFRFYRTIYGLQQAQVIGGHELVDNLQYYFDDVERMRQHPRVWMLYCNSNIYVESALPSIDYLRQAASLYGREARVTGDRDRNWMVSLFEFEEPNAGAVLFGSWDETYRPSHPSMVLRADERPPRRHRRPDPVLQ